MDDVCKVVDANKHAILKRHLGDRYPVYKIVKINVNKVTFDIYDSVAYNNMEETEFDSVKLCCTDKIGESMILKVDDAVIDQIIEYYNDIIIKPLHEKGIVIGIVTFEEIAPMSIDCKCVDDYLESLVRK